MMYLIDTHVLLWYMGGDKRLSADFINKIEDNENDLFFSKASLWEIAIKLSTGKLRLTMPIAELENYLKNKSIRELDFGYPELIYLSSLPFYHNDPFDRLIISQAITHQITVLTDDEKFKSYPVQLL